MKACVFRLRTSEEPLVTVAGWLPSADVGEWLEEARVFVAGHPGAGVRMHVVAGEGAGSVAGVVLVVTGVAGAVRFRPRVVALGELWPGVLVPVRSRAGMALTEAEVRAMFPRQLHFVHPVLGVTGWNAEEAVLPESLLGVPERRDVGWMDAVPGAPVVAALRHLGLDEGRNGDGFLASEAGGIGESAGVEPGPEGWSASARRAGAAMGDLGAGALRAMGRDAAASRLDAWSRRFRQDLAERRKAEIERLLEAFGSDPAGALRLAIPLVGGGKGRGPGPLPGTVLGERPEEWDPMRNGGGGGDEWAVDHATRLRLERAYREAAVRESAAGRWLRAARIYGELLGDWAMAAQMLERAGRWREAARVYRERLRVPGKAAGCFESAGLLSEAVAAWREVGNHEKAGELLARLGQEEEARREWEQAVRVSRDPLKQAELLERRLGRVERALEVLGEAWRNGRNGAAFEEFFALLGRLGRHGEARGMLEEMGRHPERGVRPRTAMMAALRTVFLGYPEAGVRGAAAETALVVAGDALGRKQSGDAARFMVTELARFFPGDVLLGDDAARYLAGKRMAVPAVRRAAAVRVADRVLGPEAGGEGECRWESVGMDDGRVTMAGMRLRLPREVVWRDEKRPWVVERVLGELELPETVEAVEHLMTGAGPVVLGTYAGAWGGGAACLRRCPAVVVRAGAGTHPLRAFRVVGEDPVFRWTLVSWMLMGFANLTMFPLRVEYLSNRRYGLDLSAEEVALLTSVIPNVARLCFTRAWGRLFDRMNFLTLRALLNTGFMLGILSFFTGGGMTGLVAGALLFGVSNAGADVAWTLWVTKFAPPGRVTEYMAVHTFLTGLRGVVAPFAAFYLALHAGIATTAVVMAGMILVASLILPRGKSRAAGGG